MASFLVITVRRFNKNELWPTLKVIQKRGHSYTIASTHPTIKQEGGTQVYNTNCTLDEVSDTSSFDALMIVSGKHIDTVAFWNNTNVARIVSQLNARQAPIGAICVAVPAIRHICKGIKVSAYPLGDSKKALNEAGALLQPVSLTTDGNIVTGENEVMTSMVVTNLCDLVEGKGITYVLHKSAFKRTLKPRKPIPELEHIKNVIERTGKDELSGK